MAKFMYVSVAMPIYGGMAMVVMAMSGGMAVAMCGGMAMAMICCTASIRHSFRILHLSVLRHV